MSDDVARYLLRLGEGSRRSMRAALERFAAAHGADDVDALEWHELTADDVATASASVRDVYAPRSAAQTAAALRGVLKVASQTHPEFDPTRLVGAIVRARGTRELAGRALAPAELTALFEAASRSRTAARDAAALGLLYGAGLRRREAAALLWCDVRGIPASAVTFIGKGDRERTVPLPLGTSAALEALRRTVLEEGRAIARVSAGEYRTPAPSLEIAELPVLHLSPSGVYMLVLRMKRTAGLLEHVTPHDLRRSYVSDAIDSSGDPMAVARNVGHVNVQTTFGYDRRGERAAVKAAASLHVPYVPPLGSAGR
jgi:integrase